MLYTINTDANNYIVSIAHTSKDNIDIDISTIELKYLNAYKLAGTSIVLDEERKALIEKEMEDEEKKSLIEELTLQLESTNDDILAFLEEITSLDNPLTFVADLIALMKKYSSLVSERQSIREQIKELKK